MCSSMVSGLSVQHDVLPLNKDAPGFVQYRLHALLLKTDFIFLNEFKRHVFQWIN